MRFLPIIVACVLSLATLVGWNTANETAVPPDARLFGAAYQPYRPGQGPEPDQAKPTREQIEEDMTILARHVRAIRTYTATGTAALVPEIAARHGLDVVLGVWISADVERNRQEVAAAAELVRRHPNIRSIVVGNETLLRDEVKVPELGRYLIDVRSRTGLPVTTAEPWTTWLYTPELARYVDYINIHVLPYWEDTTTENAIGFAQKAVIRIMAAYPNHRIVVGETGWPSGGKAWWGKEVNLIAQANYVRTIMPWLAEKRIETYVMEAFDSPWKYSIEGAPGAYWGVWDAGRTMKFPLTGPVESLPNWLTWAVTVISGALSLVVMLATFGRSGPLGLAVKAVAVFAIANLAGVIALSAYSTYLPPALAVSWGALVFLLALALLVASGDVGELAGLVGKPRPRRDAPALPADARRPVVSIHIPTHREPPGVVIETLQALSRLRWPDFQVVVFDNNTPEEHLWAPVRRACEELNAALGRPVFTFVHQLGVKGFKGGALDLALEHHTRPDAAYIAVIDADYTVAPDWLERTVPLMEADAGIGFVQAPQKHRDRDQSLFKRWIYWEYDGFFHIGMVERDKDESIILHGTMVVVRRAALEAVGGWSCRTICEDAELGLRLHAAGWRSAYIPATLGEGLMPDDWSGYAKQRYRWAYGAMRIMLSHRKLILPGGGLNAAQAWRYMAGWLPWIGDGLGVIFSYLALAWTVAWMLVPEHIELPPAVLFVPAITVFAVRVLYGFGLHRLRVPCGFWDSVRATVAGMALAPTIGLATLHAFLAPDMPFRRTPKGTSGSALGEALRGVRLEAATASVMLGIAAWTLIGWYVDPDAVMWSVALALQAMPWTTTVVMAVLSAGRAEAAPAHAAVDEAAPAVLPR